jgi:hypothetical protein
MADPFSILTGTASLLDISWRLVSFLSQVQAAAGHVEEDITNLSHEIAALISVNEAIEALYAAERGAALNASVSDSGRIETLWSNTGAVLKICRDTVEKLERLVKGIIGKDGLKVTGKLDGFKKLLRKESKDAEFQQLRQILTNQQNSLQMLLIALNCGKKRAKCL